MELKMYLFQVWSAEQEYLCHLLKESMKSLKKDRYILKKDRIGICKKIGIY